MWASPDFTLNKKVGTEIDHALLMASIFRTVKQEDLTEFTKFVKEMKKKTQSKRDREMNEIMGNDEADAKSQSSDSTDEGKFGMTAFEKEKKADEDIDDRVFICMGKSSDGFEKIQVWVMTINRTYDTVQFWDVKEHKHYTLRGRIAKG